MKNKNGISNAEDKAVNHLKAIDRIGDLFAVLLRRVYPNDWEMANAGASLVERIRESDEFKYEHAKMLLGMYLYAKTSTRFRAGDLLTCLFHDCVGLLRDDEIHKKTFLPRASTYLQYFDRSVLDSKISFE